jgi:hypothetical protein
MLCVYYFTNRDYFCEKEQFSEVLQVSSQQFGMTSSYWCSNRDSISVAGKKKNKNFCLSAWCLTAWHSNLPPGALPNIQTHHEVVEVSLFMLSLPGESVVTKNS